MQNRYAGDVGDFIKLGLLRHLARGSPDLRIGINWYLASDENHNADGNHLGYLSPGNRFARLRELDAALYDGFSELVADDRSVERFRELGALYSDWQTFNAPVPATRAPEPRRDWHHAATEELKSADLIYLDPDNGLAWHRAAITSKHALTSELLDYLAGGKSVIFYQHADRSRGGALAQATHCLNTLEDLSGIRPVGAVIGRRGSCRFFMVIAAPRHARALAAGVETFAAKWAPHASLLKNTSLRIRLPGQGDPIGRHMACSIT